MPVNRRKPRKTAPSKIYDPKTARRELPPETKAYAVGAMTAGVSQWRLAKQLPITQSALSKLLLRTQARSEESKLPLWDPHLYETDVGRSRPEIELSPEQKAAIIAVATQDKEAREKQSWQAIADGDFDHLRLPIKLSVTTFENLMYQSGYGRRAPGRKPTLNDAQRKRRLEWALAHNPDLHEYGDRLGFNFQRVIFTDETPARVGEQRGLLRAWAKEDEIYHPDVKRPKIRNNCALQFYGSFTYDAKGPCYIYGTESPEAKKLAKQALDEENQRNKEQRQQLVPRARAALRELGDANAN
ncbi:hypothetical protein BU23DRAFT_386562, partial [Bimuria novae-zelandiae CBS 107.79]